MTHRSDEYLLELALGGDGDCFGELIERWQGKIYAFILRQIGNRDDAHDLTQDTFTKAFENLDRLADPSRFSAWLYKIALNECRMRFRRQKRVKPLSLDEESGPGEALENEEIGPEDAFLARESAGRLHSAFENLPEEQRLVIIMKEYQGLKFQEISDVLDVPLSTVKSRMYLGLKTLKKLMESEI